MMNTQLTQSQKRFKESLGSLFDKEQTGARECLFLKSSTDTGVIRNGGRNGARFAPKSFLSTFRKFSMTEALLDYSFKDFEVSDEEEEKRDFHASQTKEAEKIRAILEKHRASKVCHIGGGHDHIYPLLKALSPEYKKIIVINVDAHADTRIDENFHSGTPFRQFATDYEGDFHLYQIGLHPFANSLSTISPLPKGKFMALWRRDLTPEKLKEIFEKINPEVNEETLVVFSLDADALAGSIVPGVSAVNPQGLELPELMLLWKHYINLPLKHETVLGIYELNPVYDTLACISMRVMGSFVFDTL
jgi:formiminoglutamase